MSKLVWNAPGERFFETGLDRGVLYPEDGPGVAWNGLVAVSDTPTGGEATPYYIDGVRYYTDISVEDVGGTITAFTYPDEFSECDGTAFIGNGMGITSQQRKPFCLSYRTRMGNDLRGTDYGYKIHVIYNALVTPAAKDHNSINASVDPNNFTWTFTTTPIKPNAYFATAHLIIDSTKASKTQMALIEQKLYGTANTEPQLYPIEELIDIFEHPPVLLRIIPNTTSGHYQLVEDEENADLMGIITEGHYVMTDETRLVETERPGFYILEEE